MKLNHSLLTIFSLILFANKRIRTGSKSGDWSKCLLFDLTWVVDFRILSEMTTIKTNLIWIIAVLLSIPTIAQDTLNQKVNGKPDGYWIYYGKDKPGKGIPDDGKHSEGRFINGRKQGKWIIYHKDGKTPKTIGTFSNGRPNGDYKKYHDDGNVAQIGSYNNGIQTGDYKILSPEGVVLQEKTFNNAGKTEGRIIFRRTDGSIELEAERKNGEAVGVEVRRFPNGDIKSKTTYGAAGTEPKKETFDRVSPEKKISETTPASNKRSPDGSLGRVNQGTFKPSGYNKVYNDDLELWMDGDFKNNKLWDGKLYKYDSDGILLKIEIWKNGRYHSDGQLN